jgi:hypothetical protein
MLDPIIREIRLLRAKRSKELRRDPHRAIEESQRKVLAMATDLVQTGPHTFRATFKVPDDTRRKQRIR